MQQASAFILAGGKSSRMGQEKAFLPFQGMTLLERALATARQVAPDVRIVGSAPKFLSFAETVEDQFSGAGPLAGIHAALTASSFDLNLILAVDTPFVEARFLAYLLLQAQSSNATITVPRTEQSWQPLCAVYRRDFASRAELALRAGRNRIDPFFAETDVRIIDEREMTAQHFYPDMFRNLNTPEEFERALLLPNPF